MSAVRVVRFYRKTRQKLVGQFIRRSWGQVSLYDPQERARRVLEEAWELAQAEGLTLEDGCALGAFVFAKPVGKAPQEAAGVAVTLMAWAECYDLDLEDLEQAEVERILALPLDQLRAKHQLKVEAGVGIPLAKLATNR